MSSWTAPSRMPSSWQTDFDNFWRPLLRREMEKLLIRHCEVLTFEGREPRFLDARDILIEGSG